MNLDGFSPGQDATRDAGEAQQARDAARDSMFLQATLSPLSGAAMTPFNVRVRNLSAGGMMAESDAVVALEDRITIRLRNVGEVGGKVAWVRAGRFGVTFDEAIDPKLARKPVKQDVVQPIISGSGFHRTTHLLG